MQKWEYQKTSYHKIASATCSEHMNKQAAKGWVLVSANTYQSTTHLFWKRPA